MAQDNDSEQSKEVGQKTEESDLLSEKNSKSKKPKKNKTKTKPASSVWPFPKNTLEDAINIPKAIEEQNAGNPMKADMLVKAVGFKKSSDWRFGNLLRSANLYGLVDGSGANVEVSMTDIGNNLTSPESPTHRQKALLDAFKNVPLFKEVYEYYQDKKLPETEFFENTLVRHFSIPRERVQTFIDIFTANLNFLKAFRADGPSTTPEQTKNESLIMPDKPVKLEDQDKGRTYLDTCFVMMPFGNWQDLYYKEIFSAAIKDAGMEPVRADELFSTGSVIEQVWEQIQKSKILLADLTNKNANVFYELGLAHAVRKPVVFTTANLEDVPFDLRHLRVIVYDTRDPFWGEKLKGNLSIYLKNAKNDPEKSIPQPFRKKEDDEDEDGNGQAKSIKH